LRLGDAFVLALEHHLAFEQREASEDVRVYLWTPFSGDRSKARRGKSPHYRSVRSTVQSDFQEIGLVLFAQDNTGPTHARGVTSPSLRLLPRRRSLDGRSSGRNSMAKGLYLQSDGQVLVEYGKRRRVPIPCAQYKANGYKPPCDKLPPEVPRKARKEFADAEA
jgi:hypothetical protein